MNIYISMTGPEKQLNGPRLKLKKSIVLQEKFPGAKLHSFALTYGKPLGSTVTALNPNWLYLIF